MATGPQWNRVRSGELPWTRIDVLHRIDAAKALGLKTAYVHRPLEYGSGRATKPSDAGRFDFSATNMNDLATQLGL